MMKNCFRSTILMLAVVAMCANAHAINLFTDGYDGADIQDAIGQTGSEAPLTYSTNSVPAGGGGPATIVEGGGILTIDAGGFSGFNEFSPDHNFNTADIDAAGGFTVEMNDANANLAGVGGQGSWIGMTLFEAPGGDGNVLASVYSFLFRDNGESVVLSDFGGANQQFLFTGPDAGLATGDHDLRFEVTIDEFSAAGSATVQAFVDGVPKLGAVSLTGLDLSNNHVWVRQVDAEATLGELSITIVPEPSSLMLAGLAGLALVMRRRK